MNIFSIPNFTVLSYRKTKICIVIWLIHHAQHNIIYSFKWIIICFYQYSLNDSFLWTVESVHLCLCIEYILANQIPVLILMKINFNRKTGRISKFLIVRIFLFYNISVIVSHWRIECAAFHIKANMSFSHFASHATNQIEDDKSSNEPLRWNISNGFFFFHMQFTVDMDQNWISFL